MNSFIVSMIVGFSCGACIGLYLRGILPIPFAVIAVAVLIGSMIYDVLNN